VTSNSSFVSSFPAKLNYNFPFRSYYPQVISSSHTFIWANKLFDYWKLLHSYSSISKIRFLSVSFSCISLSCFHSITMQTISNKSKFPSPWSRIFRHTHAQEFSNMCEHQRIVIIFVCFILYVGHVLMKYSNVLNYVFMPFPLFYCSAFQSPSKSFTLKKNTKIQL